MGDCLEVYRTFDKAEIFEVLLNPAIMKTISEGDAVLGDVDPHKTCFIACRANDELAAVWLFDKIGARAIEIHAHVLPNHRRISKDLGAAIMRHIITISPWCEKYVAQIPFCYENVKNFACSFGMQVEGVNRKSYLYNDELIDQWYLGATRQELEDGLD